MKQIDYNDYYLIILEPCDFERLGKHARGFEYDDITIPTRPTYVLETNRDGFYKFCGIVSELKNNSNLTERLRQIAKLQGLEPI